MTTHVLQISSRGPARRRDLRYRLEGIVAIFDRLESEELLAALPSCPMARRNHLKALRLLTDVETELRGLLIDIPALAG